MELRIAESAHFLTLTYNPQSLPVILKGDMAYATLDKKHVTLFLKAIRARISRDYPETSKWTKKGKNGPNAKIRYFFVGEYGSTTSRPHYHTIIFNIPLEYFQDDPLHGNQYSDILEEIWDKGRIDIGTVETASIHYCTKYHLFPLDKWDDNDPRQKPFALMSRKPGLGNNYLDDNTINYFGNTANNYATLKNGSKVPLGRYYKQKIAEGLTVESVREMRYRAISESQEEDEKYRASFASEKDQYDYERKLIASIGKRFERQVKRNKGKL
jgi:hypothetical protein